MRKLTVLASMLVLAGSLGDAALFAGSAPSFAAARSYATGRSPESVAIGDVNDDGKPDLVTANGHQDASAGAVGVLFNKGDGSFRSRRDFVTGPNPGSVVVADLNGDGKPDLATANEGANTVSVLLNSGDGSFQAKRDYAAGGGANSVAIGDLNGDGKPDLATTNFDQVSTVSVLANRGDGSFEAKIDYRTGRFPMSVAIGDLNGDGRSDLATANYAANTASVLLYTPGLCTVQNVRGKALPAAKRTIARAHCRVGRIRRAYARIVQRGRVISQKPRPGTVLRSGGKVNLVVSRGRRVS